MSSRKARHTSESKGEREKESALARARNIGCVTSIRQRGKEGEVQKLCRTQSQLQEGVGLREKFVFFSSTT